MIYIKTGKNISHLFFMVLDVVRTSKKTNKSMPKSIFIKANIDVKEDTYAAVYSAAQKRKKSIFIIGTGSNCTYFDGENIHQKITSLGYVLRIYAK